MRAFGENWIWWTVTELYQFYAQENGIDVRNSIVNDNTVPNILVYRLDLEAG